MQLADSHGRELFDLYVFTAVVAEEMLNGISPENNCAEFSEMLGMTTGVGVEAAKVLRRLQEIRQTHPQVYEAWANAVVKARSVARRERRRTARDEQTAR